jgi:hypothetical protein
MRLTTLLLLVPAILKPGAMTAQTRTAELRDLQFRIVSVQVVPELAAGDNTSLRPEPGFRIVTVALSGNMASAGRVTCGAAAFAARYEQRTPAGQEVHTLSGARRVAMAEGNWLTGFTTEYAHRDRITLRVAFVLPDTVTHFDLLVGSAVASAQVP